jgi:hypothetical protein
MLSYGSIEYEKKHDDISQNRLCFQRTISRGESIRFD